MTETEAADRAADRLAAHLERVTSALGSPMRVDGPALLRERRHLEGLPPGGSTTSPGGACHLLPCADGWVAVSLARPTDVELLPAWLALAAAPDAPTDAAPATVDELRPLVARCSGDALGAAAGVVGLPIGVLGEVGTVEGDGARCNDLGPSAAPGALHVLDLSSLWAGPLCARLLGLTGATVTKVESTARPDASRAGSPALFAALNDHKDQRSVDLATAEGIEALRALIRGADVVIESSRPRALEQLGIVAVDELARPEGPAVWVSITGHGRPSPRVAFGDDAAVAGGLVAWDGDEPRFAGDALADPLAGLTGAAAALEALAAGRRALIDVPLAHVAAAASRGTA